VALLIHFRAAAGLGCAWETQHWGNFKGLLEANDALSLLSCYAPVQCVPSILPA